MSNEDATPDSAPIPDRLAEAGAYSLLHLRLGWWTLLFFSALGFFLEGMHGLKMGFYLDVSNETRRLMWTLSHTHGTFIGLIHIAFAFTVRRMPAWAPGRRRLASPCLIGAGILIPIGFFLGGVYIHAGDPGLGIVLVPIGALMLLVAILLTALGIEKPSPLHGVIAFDDEVPKRAATRGKPRKGGRG